MSASASAVPDCGSTPTAELVRRLLVDGRLDLPHPGRGRTADRHLALIEIARTFPVGVARFAEAHVDAMAILDEAGRTNDARNVGALYGVWASAGTDDPILERGVLNGTKHFCTGSGVVERALVTVTDAAGRALLLDLDVAAGTTVGHDAAAWATTALIDTATGSVTFTDHPVDTDAQVGCAGWYLTRPGFWHGACGPAACWAGAVLGLVDAALEMTDDDPHRQAHLGAMVAAEWALGAMFRAAGHDIDEAPADVAAAELRARSLRHVTERSCADVMDRFGRALGPRPFTTNADVSRRFADTHLYLRQHHGERELGAVAKLASVRAGGDR